MQPKPKKPLFAAVIADEYLDVKVKSFGKAAIETEQGVLFADFRRKVTSRICRFFKDPTELKLIVFESLSNLERTEELEGWIRGSDVIDPKSTLEEINRLQSENTSLREQIEQFKQTLISKAITVDLSKKLSIETKAILVEAANTDGRIWFRTNDSRGTTLQVGEHEFVKLPFDHREAARWRAIMHELEFDWGFIEHEAGTTKYHVTQNGYDMADILTTEDRNIESD